MVELRRWDYTDAVEKPLKKVRGIRPGRAYSGEHS